MKFEQRSTFVSQVGIYGSIERKLIYETKKFPAFTQQYHGKWMELSLGRLLHLHSSFLTISPFVLNKNLAWTAAILVRSKMACMSNM